MHEDWQQQCPLCGGGDYVDVADCTLCGGAGILNPEDAARSLEPFARCDHCGGANVDLRERDGARWCFDCQCPSYQIAET